MSVEMEDRGKALENEYFHRREQELIEKMKTKLQAETIKSTDFNCPKCGGKLTETNYDNVKIDVCSSCSGVWLDAGELAQIVHKDKDGGWLGRVFS